VSTVTVAGLVTVFVTLHVVDVPPVVRIGSPDPRRRVLALDDVARKRKRKRRRATARDRTFDSTHVPGPSEPGARARRWLPDVGWIEWGVEKDPTPLEKANSG
jgi:hypothetical protein